MKEEITQIEQDPITQRIIACCFEVHNSLGPGFIEKIYHNALKKALDNRSIPYESEREFEVYFDGKKVGTFRCDFFVEGKVIVELKSVTGFIPPVFRNQVISYLKASKIKTGLLVNFGNKSCEVKRISN